MSRPLAWPAQSLSGMVAVVTAWALVAQVPSIALLASAGTLQKLVAAVQLAFGVAPEAAVAVPSLVSVEVGVPQPQLSAGRGWPPPA